MESVTAYIIELSIRFNENLVRFNIKFIVLVFSDWYDYSIMGSVENVFYGRSSEWPCYISMSQGGGRQYYYHAASSTAICQFAERCRNLKQEVVLYGKRSNPSNIVNGLEYAHTNSKWWE